MLHPLHEKKNPGPQPEAADPLKGAAAILDLVESGKLSKDPLPPLPKLPKRLSVADEKMLARRVQSHGCTEARNALVMANTGLVYMLCNTMRRHMVRYEDMVQEGMLGLLRATETFDPARDIRFSTYAMFWIRAKVMRYLQNMDRDDNPFLAHSEMEKMPDGRIRKPRMAAISVEGMDLNGEDRDPYDATWHPILSDDGPTPHELSEVSEATIAVRRELSNALDQIDDPRAEILLKYRLLADAPETLEQVGNRLGLSKEWVRLMERKVLTIAKNNLKDFDDTPALESA